jgi:predicted RNase H-like nuclease
VWQPEGAGPCADAFTSFQSLMSSLPPDAIIAVDMPIGLPEFIHGGGRGPEQAVRPFLGARKSSVFSVPSRAAVYAERETAEGLPQMIAAHKRASEIALTTSNPPRKVSIQAFMLFPKIREIDAFLRNETTRTDRIIESHPEFAFTVLNGEMPMALPKKIKGQINPSGIEERRSLLIRCGLADEFVRQNPPRGAASDDFLDACAMFLIAGRHAKGLTRPYPFSLNRDAYGLPIAIWA